MSNRAMGRMYSVEGRGSAGDGGGLMDLLAMLTGQYGISGGGLQTTPQGTTMQPFQGSKGFFGAGSRMRASVLNAQVLPQIAQSLNELELAKIQGANAKEIARIQGEIEANLATIRQATEFGTQERRNTGMKELATEQGEQERRKQSEGAEQSWSATKGLPPSKYAQNASALNPLLSQNLSEEQRLRSTALRDPTTQSAATMGVQSTLRRPSAEEQAMTSFIAPEGSVRTIPRMGDPITSPDLLYGGMPITKYEMSAGGYPLPISGMIKGGLDRTVPPAVKNQVLGGGGQTQTPPAIPQANLNGIIGQPLNATIPNYFDMLMSAPNLAPTVPIPDESKTNPLMQLLLDYIIPPKKY